MINNRLHKFTETNSVFNKDQYGFRVGRDTDIAISRIHETIAVNQKNKNRCDA